MKNLYIFFLAITFLSCNDGDVEIPSFDFSSTINECNDNTVLYKLGNNNSLEALILTLASSDIPTTVPTNLTKTLSLGSDRSITYRLFSESVTTGYFCQSIPPTTPTITRNWEATAGSIVIDTEVINDTNGEPSSLSNKITFTDLVLESNGEILQFDTLEFGTYASSIVVP